jgi:hypothetical protein
MIVPTVIVQTPVCDCLGLDNEVAGKRARMLTRQITFGSANTSPPLALNRRPA